ncbi:hypothetical protein BHYA_0102g00100 [Botrytis hyacinthi]|uniref:Uncharacterized protein n=1 Tax=Botrytis hyacinthi TaxID=278943 RepID=A0A4Z1GKK1_9HELO|nr:hypothetical protein BHYA_0102g00100 [Botrytis hyacinthi]
MSSPPPPEPQPQPQDCRTLIRSPDRIHRWINGAGEFNNQPISPSNNVPNSPLSGNQYDLDGVNLRSPSIGSRTGDSEDVFAAAFGQENTQTGAGFTGNNQQPNQEATNASNALLGQLNTHHNLVGQIQQRNEHLLGNIYELSPIPNPGDNTHQGLHDANNRVEDPPNSTALRYGEMNTSPTSSELSNNDITDNQYTSTMMNLLPQSPYGDLQNPSQRAHQTPTASGMMRALVDHFLQPPGQRAHQIDMITGMINPTNNYQGGMHGQVSENNPVPTQHTNHENGGLWNNPQDQEVQQNDHMLNNYNMDSTLQAVPSSGDRMPTNHLPGTTPQYVTLQSIEHSPYNPQPNASPQQTYFVDESDDDFTTPSHTLTTPSQMLTIPYTVRDAQSSVPHTPSGYVSDQRAPGPVGTGLGVSNVPGDMSSNQHIPPNGQGFNVAGVPDNMQSNQQIYSNAQGFDAPNIPGDMLSSQYEVFNNQDLGGPSAPGDMASNQYELTNDEDNMLPNQHIVHNEQDLDIANAPGNMPQSEHIDRNDQGDMPASGGDQMDTSEDQIPFGRLSTIAPLAQLFDSIPDAPQPFNAINSGPFFPQDTSSRQTFQLDSNPTTASNVEEAGAALDSGEVDTQSARIFPPNIPGTLAPTAHQPQMETSQARIPFKHPARNEKSDTRKDSPRDANRVNKSIRRRKPAKTQKLQSAIANSASQLLEESASQAVEAQNDPENSKSQAIEAQDESETSVESVD